MRTDIFLDQSGLERACCLFDLAKLALIKLDFHSTSIILYERLDQKHLSDKYRRRYDITLAAYERLVRAYKKQLFTLITSST